MFMGLLHHRMHKLNSALGNSKKFKTQPSAGKVMATVFWDAQGVIMLDFLAKKSTITGAYYANLLD